MYRKKSEARYFVITIADCICIMISTILGFYLRYGETRKLMDGLDVIVSGSYVCMSDNYQEKID